MAFNSKTVRSVAIFFLIGMAAISVSCTPSGKPVVPDARLLEELGFTPLTGDRPIPDISFQSLETDQIHRLGDFPDSVILLNFWASWCPPCRAEMPSMERLAAALDSTDFVMLAINVQEEKPLIEAFLREYELNFPIYTDPAGIAAREMGVAGLPTSLLIDRGGRAVGVVTGALEWDSEAMLDMMKSWTR